jgi:uncharacterized protein YciI
MHYLLFYEKAPDHGEREKAWHASHREYFQNRAAQGDILLGGSLENPEDGAAVILFKADSAEVVEAFAREDPYVKNGIVIKWWVRKWDLVVGHKLGLL